MDPQRHKGILRKKIIYISGCLILLYLAIHGNILLYQDAKIQGIPFFSATLFHNEILLNVFRLWIILSSYFAFVEKSFFLFVSCLALLLSFTIASKVSDDSHGYFVGISVLFFSFYIFKSRINKWIKLSLFVAGLSMVCLFSAFNNVDNARDPSILLEYLFFALLLFLLYLIIFQKCPDNNCPSPVRESQLIRMFGNVLKRRIK